MAYTTQDISGFYKKYLGRDLEDDSEAEGWLNNSNAESMIRGSGEAQEYASRTPAPAPTRTPAPNPWVSAVTRPAAPRPAATAPTAPTPAAPTTAFAAERAAIAAHPENAYGNASMEQQMRNIWNATPDHSPANLARLAAEFGVKVGGTHGDTLIMPDGRVIDAIMDVGGRNAPGWIDTSVAGGVSRGSQGEAARGGGGSSSRSSSSSSSSGPGGSMGNPYSSAERDALYAELLARSKQGLNINAQTDANIRQQADPFEAAMIRAERERMGNIAESRGPLSNLEGERRLGSERVGQAAGAFEAGLVGDEVQARRQEIQAALTQRGGILSQDQQDALQRELAMLDARLKREQMAQSASQFSAGVGLDRDKLRSSEDQFMAELGSRNQQWEDQLDLRNRGIWG